MRTRITIGRITVVIEEEDDDEDEETNDEAPVAIAQVAPILGPETTPTRGGFHLLSSREQRILELLATGLSNKEIARRLVITESTVKVHMKALLRKTRCRNRTEAATMHVNGKLIVGGET